MRRSTVLGIVLLLALTGLGLPAAPARPVGGGPAMASTLPGAAAPFASGPWTNVTPAAGQGPPGVLGSVLANDTADGVMLWFGGSVAHPGGAIGATWVYRNGSWSNRTGSLTFSPPARSFGAAAYASGSQEVVLFGGVSNGRYLNDTWVYRTGNWTNLTGFLSIAPVARAEAMLSDVPTAGTAMLYGGVNASGALSDTWTFGAGRWARQLPVHVPPRACCGSLAYDTVDAETVLVVADGADAHLYTWTYAAGDWTNRTTGSGPSGRQAAALVDDPSAGGTVLFGGTGLPRSPYWPLGDAWVFGGNRWTLARGGSTGTGGPGPRWGAVAAPEVGAPGCFLLVGGAGFNASVPAGAAVWTGCGNASVWINGTGGSSGGPNPPRVSVALSAASGVAPFSPEVNVSVSNGTAPFNLTLCTSFEGCTTHPGWSGLAPFRENVTFGQPGTYSVSALVVDALGLSGSSTATVTALAPLPLVVVPAERPASGTVPLVTAFVARVSGGTAPYAVQWDFGDGTVAAGVPGTNLTHVYRSAGTFYPKLAVTDARGQVYNATLPAIAVRPLPPAPPGPSGNGLSAQQELALGILLVGVAVAALVYAVRRRRLAELVDETIHEVRAPLPEDPKERGP